jgi:hypothetical protein
MAMLRLAMLVQTSPVQEELATLLAAYAVAVPLAKLGTKLVPSMRAPADAGSYLTPT